MKVNKITFSAPNNLEYYLKDVLPVPIKTNIPEWFKKLNHTMENNTIKGCMPFLDALTAGYLLKMPQDLFIKHNVWNEKIKKYDSFFKYSVQVDATTLNLNSSLTPQTHQPQQLEGSPLIKKNGDNLPFYKILNPYHIKTPPGYSCLFTPPINNKDDRFEIISGIVDTDKFDVEINFPFVINNDKYPSLETVIERGTPYVQIIPFKRDDWKMNVIFEKRNTSKFWQYPFLKKLLHNYKTFFWNKKKWM